ncbi:MAG: desulfoferrodoxin [Patescibacteria group bacterium]
MAQLQGIYKCHVCGNIVTVMHSGGGTLVCCGQNMELLQANTVDASLEKHVPVIEKKEDQVIVKVGSEPHPMEDAHFIEWIELIADGQIFIQFLKPGQLPQAAFTTTASTLSARIYCNLHGLWQNK